jgi:hypothetical protein
MCLQSYRRRLRIWETDYGRNAGWTIEQYGEPIACLSEPRWEDMFWDSYRLDVITADGELRDLMATREFWLGASSEGLVWRNREFGETAPFAFPAGEPFPEPGRLKMRGLYLTTGAPWPWDRCILLIRRWLQAWRGNRSGTFDDACN